MAADFVKDQQAHLKEIVEHQKVLLQQIEEMNREINSKRELIFKYQGIIEYLSQIGITLDEGAKEEE